MQSYPVGKAFNIQHVKSQFKVMAIKISIYSKPTLLSILLKQVTTLRQKR